MSADTGGMTDPLAVLVVGEGPVATAIGPMLTSLGWSPTTATTLEEVERALPAADAVVVLSHHDEVDAPAIRAALSAGTAYVGAMGSRRTQERRRGWLLAHGLTEQDLAPLRAPIGLDIGADEPGEIAVSILAEIVAVHRGARVASSLSSRDGAIHPDLEPGTATCPGG